MVTAGNKKEEKIKLQKKVVPAFFDRKIRFHIVLHFSSTNVLSKVNICPAEFVKLFSALL